MAKPSLRLDHNAPGDFYVDSSCIDCDTCRWMDPATFTRRGSHSSVARQPRTEAERRRALLALVSCPTASIGTVAKHDLAPVVAALPEPVDDAGRGPVYHCGYHDESSFGAASYLVTREEGNVLVDAPRFTRPLVRRLEELGGVHTLFLTHRDDVGDHARFAGHFGCRRVLHRRDLRPGTRDVELPVDGDESLPLDDELTVIPVPGHTEGSACLLYRDTWLFTGDHLAWSDALGQIVAFRRACWYDWGEVIRSSERLADFDFEWILPGHGRRCRFPRERMRRELARAIEWMRAA